MPERLSIELVPRTSWFINLRSELPPGGWDLVRQTVYERAGWRCEICGGKGPKWPVEAHEEWHYHPDGRQELRRVVALCPDCHRCKHPGLAQLRGEEAAVVRQLCKVNSCTPAEARAQLDAAFELWEERSRRPWRLDIEKVKRWVEVRLTAGAKS